MLTMCLVEVIMFDYKFIIMKISEVIKKLQEVQKDWGDVEVMVYDYDAFHEADEYSFYVREGKLYIRG